MNHAHNVQFLSAWFRNLRQAGALLPSGASLAQAMAAPVDPARGLVIELGVGTGAITRALIARGVLPEQLILVEKDPALFGEMARRFPGVVALQGDAAHLGRLLSRAGAGRPGTLVSSLPLLSMKRRQRLRVLIQMFSVLGVGGELVQFTYGNAEQVLASVGALVWDGLQGANHSHSPAMARICNAADRPKQG